MPLISITVDHEPIPLPELTVRVLEQLRDRDIAKVVEVRLAVADGSFDRAITYTITSNKHWTKTKLANGVARLWKEWANS